jgi:calcium homeostasis ER protein
LLRKVKKNVYISEPELKNIIDKLANFVARNGPEFENMTKQKQQDNPKFSFLFGGEHYSYYQYKVQTEQASK